MNLFKNDKNTSKDEIILCIFTAIIAVVAVLIFVFKNSIPASIQSMAITFAALLSVTVVMMLVMIIYRFTDNDKPNKED